MYAILAFIPIIVTVVLMVAFNWPAKRALPLAWILAAIIGVAVWKMSIGAVALQTVIGFLEAFAVLVLFITTEPWRISSSSTTPETEIFPFPPSFATASIFIIIPVPSARTARPFMTPGRSSSKILFFIILLYLPDFITHFISLQVMFFLFS